MATFGEMLATAVKHHQSGNLPAAEQGYRKILQANPFHAEAMHLLGVIAFQTGNTDAALDFIERAIRLQPGLGEAHNNLGLVLQAQGKHDEAIASFRTALRIKPDHAEAYNNLGITFKEQGDLQEATNCYQNALRYQPNSADAHNNLGNVFVEKNETLEAIACFDNAIRHKPDFVRAHWNRALALLFLGDFEQGWPEFEWRWRRPESPPRTFSQPVWDGSPLEGRTILLHAEQGLGDTLHFIRYAPLVKERGGRVIVECQKALVALLKGCRGIDQLVGHGTPLPDFAVHAPLMSLPAILGTVLSTIPAATPYVHADARLVDKWGQELRPLPGLKVGIAWQGSPQHKKDRLRSIPLEHFGRLARVRDVTLVSLQKGHGTEQFKDVAGRFAVIDLGSRLDETAGAFMDTAAVMKNLDLVITSDTAAAHLAGALGVPVWLALSFAPDWRWLRDRSDSPWYPSMRLFRQEQRGDWAGVFERMAHALEALPRAGPTVRVAIAPGELIDKITILEIKNARITDQGKLKNVRTELRVLESARTRWVTPSAMLETLTAELRAVNEKLWDIEDAIRRCEGRADFGPEFIALARSVYVQNDERAALKRRINELLASAIVEEKSYADYGRGPV